MLHNDNTIGIEHVGSYDEVNKTWDPVSPEMAAASAWLVGSLMLTYDLNESDIYNHEGIQQKTDGEGGTVREAITPVLRNSTSGSNPSIRNSFINNIFLGIINFLKNLF